MFAIVMAGGVGTRLWPLSRRRSPKQLLALTILAVVLLITRIAKDD